MNHRRSNRQKIHTGGQIPSSISCLVLAKTIHIASNILKKHLRYEIYIDLLRRSSTLDSFGSRRVSRDTPRTLNAMKNESFARFNASFPEVCCPRVLAFQNFGLQFLTNSYAKESQKHFEVGLWKFAYRLKLSKLPKIEKGFPPMKPTRTGPNLFQHTSHPTNQPNIHNKLSN